MIKIKLRIKDNKDVIILRDKVGKGWFLQRSKDRDSKESAFVMHVKKQSRVYHYTMVVYKDYLIKNGCIDLAFIDNIRSWLFYDRLHRFRHGTDDAVESYENKQLTKDAIWAIKHNTITSVYDIDLAPYPEYTKITTNLTDSEFFYGNNADNRIETLHCNDVVNTDYPGNPNGVENLIISRLAYPTSQKKYGVSVNADCFIMKGQLRHLIRLVPNLKMVSVSKDTDLNKLLLFSKYPGLFQ